MGKKEPKAATPAKSAATDEEPVELADTSLLTSIDGLDKSRIPGLMEEQPDEETERGDFEPDRCRHGFWKPSRDLVLRANDWLKGEVNKVEEEPQGIASGAVRHAIGELRHGVELTIESGAGLATNELNEQGPFVKAQITGGASMVTDWASAVIMFDVYERDALQTKLIGCGLLDLVSAGLTRTNTKRLDVVLTEKTRLMSNKKAKGAIVSGPDFGTLGTLRIKIAYAKRDPHKARLALSAAAKEKAGKLVTVDVVEARYLSPMDANGKADPYVVVSVGTKVEKTKTQKETLEPNWRERFDFMVTTLADPLELKIFDEDAWATDDIMGATSISLESFELDVPKAKWYTIRDSEGGEEGQVFVNVTVSSLWSDPRIITAHDRKQVAGVLTIWIKEARGIKVADANRFGTGKSDPFAVVEVGRSRYRTRTIYNTLRPKWDRKFEFLVNDAYSLVQITLNDEDQGQSFDFLGRIKLSLLDLPAGETWFALKSEDLLERAQGDLLIQASFTYNRVKAMQGLLLPREVSYTFDKEPKFNSKQLSENIARVKTALSDMATPFKTLAAISGGDCTLFIATIFMFVWYYFCLYSQLWHTPYWVIIALYLEKWKPKAKKALAADEDGNVFDVQYEDSEDEENKTPAKKKKKKTKAKGKGLFKEYQTFKRLAKDQYGTINNVASWLERVKNLFFWHQHTIAWAAVIGLLLISIVIYILRPYIKYGMLFGGYARFLKGFYKNAMLPTERKGKRKKKMPRAHAVSNGNPITNLLGRVPSDEDIMQGYRRFRPETKTKKEIRMEKMLQKIGSPGNPP